MYVHIPLQRQNQNKVGAEIEKFQKVIEKASVEKAKSVDWKKKTYRSTDSLLSMDEGSDSTSNSSSPPALPPKNRFCPQTIWVHLRLQPCLPKGQVRISINALAFPPSVLTVRNPIASLMEVWRSESKVSWIKQPPTHQEAVPPNCTYLQSSL